METKTQLVPLTIAVYYMAFASHPNIIVVAARTMLFSASIFHSVAPYKK